MATADLTLPINRIKGDPNNVRTRVSVPGIVDLAKSIKAIGLQQPIIVRPHEDGYMVVAGHRRLAAVTQLADAGDHDGNIDVVIRMADMSDADITVAQLVENLQREDIDVLDEAMGYMRLLEFEMSQAEISRQVGRSRGHVTKRLALVSLPQEAKDKLRKGDITIEHALTIASLDAEDQESYVAEGRWDTYAVERLARGSKGKKAAAKVAETVAALGVEIRERDAEHQAPEGRVWETFDVVYNDNWDGAVPEGATTAEVTSQGDQVMIRFLSLTEVDTKSSTKEEKRVEKEKARAKEERLANRAKADFLGGALAKVKATDAADIALSMALDRVGFANSKEICELLDIDVPIKLEVSYDGKQKNVKQYYPILLSLVKEARADGDIGFIRRVVLAVACTYGYKETLLELFGFDPEAE